MSKRALIVTSAIILTIAVTAFFVGRHTNRTKLQSDEPTPDATPQIPIAIPAIAIIDKDGDEYGYHDIKREGEKVVTDIKYSSGPHRGKAFRLHTEPDAITDSDENIYIIIDGRKFYPHRLIDKDGHSYEIYDRAPKVELKYITGPHQGKVFKLHFDQDPNRGNRYIITNDQRYYLHH